MIENFWVGSVAWWHTVTPEFGFLLALPFAVAAAGLAAAGLRCRRKSGTAVTCGSRRGDAGP
ncbi:hypothetical protein HZ992_16375 [Rhizobacter sp. AJA081-3]|uniref:hypothetical protein n=1 Tax=Rhizobacter sp. AJA081-3 TaxID=2753607 RepID=UPI001ADF53BF|nr:hypothetical protein [Rhizobacter sp. AJA081-3]QTN21746.1 hypothetical protein HZ992_16375 [Rhizobacter sp. AJA081-3]